MGSGVEGSVRCRMALEESYQRAVCRLFSAFLRYERRHTCRHTWYDSGGAGVGVCRKWWTSEGGHVCSKMSELTVTLARSHRRKSTSRVSFECFFQTRRGGSVHTLAEAVNERRGSQFLVCWLEVLRALFPRPGCLETRLVCLFPPGSSSGTPSGLVPWVIRPDDLNIRKIHRPDD